MRYAFVREDRVTPDRETRGIRRARRGRTAGEVISVDEFVVHVRRDENPAARELPHEFVRVEKRAHQVIELEPKRPIKLIRRVDRRRIAARHQIKRSRDPVRRRHRRRRAVARRVKRVLIHESIEILRRRPDVRYRSVRHLLLQVRLPVDQRVQHVKRHQSPQRLQRNQQSPILNRHRSRRDESERVDRERPDMHRARRRPAFASVFARVRSRVRAFVRSRASTIARRRCVRRRVVPPPHTRVFASRRP